MKRSITDLTTTTSWNNPVGGEGEGRNNVEFTRTSQLSVPYAVQSQSPSFCGISWSFERGGSSRGGGATAHAVVSSPPIGRSNQKRLTVHHTEVSNSADAIAIGSSSSSGGSDDGSSNDDFLEDYNHLASKIDALTLKEMNELSFQQRETVFNDIHGVAELKEETPEVISDHIERLDKELQRLIKDQTKDTSAYEQAMKKSMDHVQEESFRIMFLRAALFDVEVAAEKLITYFRAKLELWGTSNYFSLAWILHIDDNAMFVNFSCMPLATSFVDIVLTTS